MKRNLAAITFLCAITLALAAHARAEEVKMVFWYPGEAGSTAEAQPVIDAFIDYVSRAMAPESITGRYFNTVNGGLDYIAKQRPKVGIISYSAWTQNRAKLGNAKVVLATLPLPKGKEMQKYSLVGVAKEVPPNSKIYASEPFGLNFAKRHLFPNLPQGVKLEQTDRIFMKIKKIANGEENALAILTPIETATLKKLKADWSRALKFIETSQAVPTARVVVFDNGWKGKEKFSEVLLAADKDPKATEILEEMRLKGFGMVRKKR